MDFESIKQMLEKHEMEGTLVDRSEDLYSVRCKRDGDYINTIQVIDDFDDKGPSVHPKAVRLLERTMKNHRELLHPPDYQVSIYEEVAAEPVFKLNQ